MGPRGERAPQSRVAHGGRAARRTTEHDMASDRQTFRKGDRVAWDTSQGETTGRVMERVTSETSIKGHVAKATPEDPEYRVRSDKTGAEAIHRPEELRRIF